MDITIPMNNMDYETIARTRVFFGPIGSMVLIYIPNSYIQLVDCGAHHPVYPGLTLTGPELATKIPTSKKQKQDIMPAIIPYHTKDDPSSLLDCNRGIYYEYLLDRSAVLSIFKKLK